jgi:site-specific DNA recombinase
MAKQPLLKQAPSPTRAAIYVRVSTEDQAEQGYGIDVQLDRCRALARAKDLQVVAEYRDDGISGTKGAADRPGLAALLEAASEGKIDAVIVLALDRLGRKTVLVLSLVEELAKAGCALLSCKESLDTSTPQGQFVLTMFAALAQLERDVIVERTTAGRNERGRRDGEKGGRVPYGYIRTSEGDISIEPAAAATVRRIFALADGGASLREIAAQLADLPTSRGGKQWYASSVREVLLNRADYLGGYRGDSTQRWPSILDT